MSYCGLAIKATVAIASEPIDNLTCKLGPSENFGFDIFIEITRFITVLPVQIDSDRNNVSLLILFEVFFTKTQFCKK